MINKEFHCFQNQPIKETVTAYVQHVLCSEQTTLAAYSFNSFRALV